MFEDKKPLSPSALERVGAVVKAAASVNPLAAATAETLGQMLGHVFGSRRDDWLEALAAKVEDLERERGITLEDLAKNQAFLDAVFQASAAAARTHREEKREALRNAVINSALPGSPSEDLQQIFIGWVERLTPSHLKILRLIMHGVAQNDPNVYASSDNARPLHQVLQREHPELLSNGGLLQVIGDDLESLGLITRPSRDWLGASLIQIREAGFAVDFLRFISAPEVR